MTASFLDSTLFEGLLSDGKMRSIFSPENLLQKWLDFEAALARAEASVGLVPLEAAEEISRRARADHFRLEDIQRGIQETAHPIVPMVRLLAGACSGGAGAYVHWGATTQDVTDTGLVLLLRDAYPLLDEALVAVIGHCLDLAGRYRDVVMPGRTHGQHALPVTFGYKVAVWADELDRHHQRLDESRPRVLVGQFGGAVGTLAATDQQGLAIRKALMRELELGEATITWHTARDRLAEFAGILGMIAATVEKIATEIIHLQRTELAEVEEPFHFGKVGSSTMPHKRNPMYCEAIQAFTVTARRDAGLALDAMVQQHERDWGRIQNEWDFLPRATVYTYEALQGLARVLEGLRVDPERMRRNVDLLQGLILSESVMIGLARYLGRQAAHDVVYRASMQAFEERRPLVDVLAGDEEVSRHLSRDDLEQLLDPARYTGRAADQVDAVIDRLRRRLQNRTAG